MIEERRQDIRKHLEDPDDEDSHDNPFPDFLGQRVFHNPPEQQAENGNDDRHDDGGPEHEAFAENQLVHRSRLIKRYRESGILVKKPEKWYNNPGKW